MAGVKSVFERHRLEKVYVLVTTAVEKVFEDLKVDVSKDFGGSVELVKIPLGINEIKSDVLSCYLAGLTPAALHAAFSLPD